MIDFYNIPGLSLKEKYEFYKSGYKSEKRVIMIKKPTDSSSFSVPQKKTTSETKNKNKSENFLKSRQENEKIKSPPTTGSIQNISPKIIVVRRKDQSSPPITNTNLPKKITLLKSEKKIITVVRKSNFIFHFSNFIFFYIY